MMESPVEINGGFSRSTIKPHSSSKDRPGCHLFGFWLDEHTSDVSTSKFKQFTLLLDSVKVYFGSCIIKDNKFQLLCQWRN